MGILDDAIRDHLELKRRRGADPADIERMEREALGPVRRVAESGDPAFDTGQPAVAYDEPEPYTGAGAPAEAAEEEWGYEEEEALLPGESWEHGEPVGAESAEPEFEYSQHEPPTNVVFPEEPEPVGDPPATPPPAAAAPPAVAPPAPEPDVGGETVEYDIEAEHARAAEEHAAFAPEPEEPEPEEPELAAPEPGREGEDVLAETPEFFQDAPEHDRLWFEQRPPKDFDFDG
jgi:hypothetical protein